MSLKIVFMCFQDSLTVLTNVYADRFVKGAKVYDKFQFERNGFFSVDPDSTENKVSKCYFGVTMFHHILLFSYSTRRVE